MLTFWIHRLGPKWRVQEVNGSQDASHELRAADDERHVLQWTRKGQYRNEASAHENRQHWTATFATLVADLLQQNLPLRRRQSHDDLEGFGEDFQQRSGARNHIQAANRRNQLVQIFRLQNPQNWHRFVFMRFAENGKRRKFIEIVFRGGIDRPRCR